MNDPDLNEQGVPLSAGIPPIIVYAGLIGIALIFIVAGMVLGTSNYGHMWPAANTLQLKL